MVELKKRIGFLTIMALTIVSLLGTSIFFGAGIAAGISGAGSIIAWIAVALVAVYVSACFGELISMFPNAGGVYEFAKQAYGRFPSFLIGWVTWIVQNITTAVIIVAAVQYSLPGSSYAPLKILLVVGIIVILNYIAYRGIDLSSKVLILFASITLIIILLIVLPGILHVDQGNFEPMTITPLLFFFTIFFIIESFFGWESASFMAEETVNAEKVVPWALFLATVVSIILGILIAGVQIGILGVERLASSTAAFLDTSFIIYGDIGVKVMNIGIVLSLIGSAAGGIISNPRLLLALGRDKLFPDQVSHIHPKYNTPYKAIIFQTFVATIFVLISFGRYKTVLSYLVPLALFMYISVLLSVVVLRRKKKDHPRPFKVPLGGFLPLVVVIFYAAIIVAWAMMEPGGLHVLRILGSFLFLGIPIYMLLTFYYNPSIIIKFSNVAADINYFLEDLFLPKSVRKRILSIFRNMKDKTVLELGSGVGTLTLHLAEEVGPEGKIIAIDLSEKNLKILRRRLKEKDVRHVDVIHDEHMVNRVHPDITKVDMVFSVGHLTYIQDMKKVLREVYDVLPENGRICFVEYIDFFYFLPNKSLISNQTELKKAFREAGFSVNIQVIRSLFWKFIFIYGIKSGEEEVVMV
ncbi:MAG: amino acid permease [Nanoarchaeota archaeon]